MKTSHHIREPCESTAFLVPKHYTIRQEVNV